MTRLVARPDANGFTNICVRFSAPLPLVVSPMTQRTVSPAATATRFSPGCSAMSRSEEHTSELQSLMRISYAVFCLNKQNTAPQQETHPSTHLSNKRAVSGPPEYRNKLQTR